MFVTRGDGPSRSRSSSSNELVASGHSGSSRSGVAGVLVLGLIILGAYTAIELSRFQRVEARRTTLVYAAGQRLFPGVNVRAIDLAGTLRRLKYKEVQAPVTTPGQFRRAADVWELYLRGVEDSREGGPTRAIRD